MVEIIPAVDVLDGRVVRLVHGDYRRVTVYAEDPVAQARAWTDQGAGLVHVVDLEGARSGSPDRDLWFRLADAALGLMARLGGWLTAGATWLGGRLGAHGRRLFGSRTVEGRRVHGVFARAWPIGTTALWIAVLLTTYVFFYYIA